MKKYVSLIVCAVITLAALIIPIGSGARYDGKGSGKNQPVKNLSELSNSLENSSATYTLTYSEGINISRHSLSIYRENYQNETETSVIGVYKDETLQVRVEDLHSGNTEAQGYGRLYNQFDFVNFDDYNMDTGIVKIKYQTDNYGNTEVANELWMGYGYSSASDLGLETKEATDAIAVYSDSAKTNKVLDIQKGQIFILTGEENGKTIQYSKGEGFETGYIDSNSYRDVYVASYFDEVGETAVKEGGSVNTNSGVKYFNNKECLGTESGFLYHGTNYRYYSSEQVTYQESNFGIVTNKVVDSAKISVNINGEWVEQYCVSKNIATRVDTSLYERPFTGNYDRGTIKVYKTADAVYAQVNSEMTLAHNKTNIRATINAEFLLKGNKNLIKINSFFYADDSGVENQDAMEFLTGSKDGTTYGESKIKINQWVDAKDAKIYFDANTRPTDEFINPLNFFVDKYFNADGSLKYNDFLASLVELDLLQQDGKKAFVKSSIKESELCIGLYNQVFSNTYDEFFPEETENTTEKAIVDIDFSNKKMPVIKTKYIYSISEVSIFDGTSNCTSKFETSSDRMITIENVGNTVIPKVVLEEVKGLLG